MYYYAVLNHQSVASSAETSSTPINDVHYIEITQDQYNNFDAQLMGKSWDPYTQQFVDRIYWSANTNAVHDSRKHLGMKLCDSLTMMDEKIDSSMKVANDIQIPLTLAYGTMSGSYTGSLEVNGTYLVCVNYLNSSALVERCLYAMTVVQRGLCKVIPLIASTNLDVVSNNGTFSFSTQHTSATSATVRIV